MLPKQLLILIIALTAIRLDAVKLNAFSRLHEELPIPIQVSKAAEIKWIEQRVDNFDLTNMETWNMRYMENREHFIPGGPIFIYIGGEWTISPGWIQGGHTYDIAKELNGYLFYTEHRFYGQSHPTSDASTENLRYLTVDQALADLAFFISHVRDTIDGLENSQVIVVGGSYSATMATWLRKKYPHLVTGAWASSGPLLAQVDFIEYKEVVGESFYYVGGRNCHDRLQTAFRQMEQLIANNMSYLITDKFNFCSLIDTNNQLDIWGMFYLLSDELAGVVQYHWPGDIESACDAFTNPSVDAVTALANWFNARHSGCVDMDYEGFIEFYSNPDWTSPGVRNAGRQWIYQTCAEFGWYQTSNSPNQPFGTSFPLDLFIQTCTNLYGSLFNDDSIESHAVRINQRYGGLTPGVTNVYFTQGQLDPWRPMGIQEDLNESSPATVIPMHSHCADLYSISPYDTPAMLSSKLRVRELIIQWLSEGN